MAWSWSHTADAYEAVHEQINEQSREWLETVYAEWALPEGFDPALYGQALNAAKTLPSDVLADYIWQQTTEQATCTNGGHMAYCCPFGCHLLPFTPPEEPDDWDDDWDAHLD